MRMQKNANDDAARGQITMLEGAVKLYTLDVGTCPTTPARTGRAAPRAVRPEEPGQVAGPLSRKQLPVDPWGNDYQYEQIADPINSASGRRARRRSGSEDDIDATPRSAVKQPLSGVRQLIDDVTAAAFTLIEMLLVLAILVVVGRGLARRPCAA